MEKLLKSPLLVTRESGAPIPAVVSLSSFSESPPSILTTEVWKGFPTVWNAGLVFCAASAMEQNIAMHRMVVFVVFMRQSYVFI